jgi:hypothetical protein
VSHSDYISSVLVRLVKVHAYELQTSYRALHFSNIRAYASGKHVHKLGAGAQERLQGVSPPSQARTVFIKKCILFIIWTIIRHAQVYRQNHRGMTVERSFFGD